MRNRARALRITRRKKTSRYAILRTKQSWEDP